VLGFFVFVFPIAQFEFWALLHPLSLFLLVPLGLGAWYLLSQLRGETTALDDQLIFEEIPPTTFEVLDLSR
jgi:ACR3 family arsenite efflux pump ArsB